MSVRLLVNYQPFECQRHPGATVAVWKPHHDKPTVDYIAEPHVELGNLLEQYTL